MLHPTEPASVPQGRSPASASYHVGLDTMMGRRSRDRPEEVTINGFLLLDTGEYELVTAHVPLDVFWKMKALDVVGNVRTANRARAGRAPAYPCVGSVWLVDGDLEAPATMPADNGNDTETRREDRETKLLAPADEVLATAPGGGGPGTDEPAQRIFQLQVRAVHSLDRVAIGPGGPRFIETLHLRDMLPELRAD